MSEHLKCQFVRYVNDGGSLWGVLYTGIDNKPYSIMTDADYDYVKQYTFQHFMIDIPSKDSKEWIVRRLS